MGALVEPGDNHQHIDHHQVGTGTEDEDECGMNHNAKNHANCQNTPCTALIGNHSGVNGPHEQAGNREQCSGQAGLRSGTIQHIKDVRRNKEENGNQKYQNYGGSHSGKGM